MLKIPSLALMTISSSGAPAKVPKVKLPVTLAVEIVASGLRAPTDMLLKSTELPPVIDKVESLKPKVCASVFMELSPERSPAVSFPSMCRSGVAPSITKRGCVPSV